IIMKCEECHENDATLHLTKFVNGQKSEVNVCEECALNKGHMSYPGESYSLHDLLTGLFSLDTNQFNVQEDPFKQKEVIQCSTCQLTYDDFQRVGKFGCAHCYTAFSSRLDTILRRVHNGNTKKTRKKPKRKGSSLHTKKEIERHRKILQLHIEKEEFEKAAEVRDLIRTLENQKNEQAGDHS